MKTAGITIEPDQCKGCRLCVEVCPNHCIVVSSHINTLGYQYARFERKGCTACGFCYYICPEPGAITVYQSATATAEAGERAQV